MKAILTMFLTVFLMVSFFGCSKDTTGHKESQSVGAVQEDKQQTPAEKPEEQLAMVEKRFVTQYDAFNELNVLCLMILENTTDYPIATANCEITVLGEDRTPLCIDSLAGFYPAVVNPGERTYMARCVNDDLISNLTPEQIKDFSVSFQYRETDSRQELDVQVEDIKYYEKYGHLACLLTVKNNGAFVERASFVAPIFDANGKYVGMFRTMSGLPQNASHSIELISTDSDVSVGWSQISAEFSIEKLR